MSTVEADVENFFGLLSSDTKDRVGYVPNNKKTIRGGFYPGFKREGSP
jgi:hypothetical protein